MIWDHYEFKIADTFLSPIINGDYTYLEDEEIAQINAFELDAFKTARESGFIVGHWAQDSDESDDWGACAVTGLFAMRQTVKLMVYKS